MTHRLINAVSLCRVKATADSGWTNAVALLKTPGTYDAAVIVALDGTVMPEVHTYQLLEYAGCFLIPEVL